MSDATTDPRCPECGGPIGMTATYCMHCSADLTDERVAADANDNRVWDSAEDGAATGTDWSTGVADRVVGVESVLAGMGRGFVDALGISPSAAGAEDGRVLHPDGLVDNTLTVVVGSLGGILVGVIGTIVLGVVTGSPWAIVFGLFTWVGATAHLVRRRTVQGAVARTGYAVALVLLVVPVIAFSPVMEMQGGIIERGGMFLVLLVFVAVPAGIAAVVGLVASQFVPRDDIGRDG